MLRSDNVDLAIYEFAEAAGTGRRRPTNLSEMRRSIAAFVGGEVENITVVNGLKRLAGRRCIDLDSYEGLNSIPYSPDGSVIAVFSSLVSSDEFTTDKFFYRREFGIRVTELGEPDFQQKQLAFRAGRLFFISCGQTTSAEKVLGSTLTKLINDTGVFQAYFAEEVQDLNGLAVNIFRKLDGCSGFVTVLHNRGTVTNLAGHRVTRASVWIEQEIAIVSFLAQVYDRKIDIITYRQKEVSIEGIRQLIQLNPVPFEHDEEVISDFARRISEMAESARTAGAHRAS